MNSVNGELEKGTGREEEEKMENGGNCGDGIGEKEREKQRRGRIAMVLKERRWRMGKNRGVTGKEEKWGEED